MQIFNTDLGNAAECRCAFLRQKWRTAYEKLIAQHTQAPEINLLVMLLAFDHLWRQVIECATEGGPPARLVSMTGIYASLQVKEKKRIGM